MGLIYSVFWIVLLTGFIYSVFWIVLLTGFIYFVFWTVFLDEFDLFRILDCFLIQCFISMWYLGNIVGGFGSRGGDGDRPADFGIRGNHLPALV
jgi:hypothetical protein